MTTTGHDSEPVQLLTADGRRLDRPGGGGPDDRELARMYRDMVLVRRIDEEAIALQRQGELGLWTSLRGQEAAQVGAGYALRASDMVFPSYREHGIAWCRGLDPVQLLAMWRGSSTGGWDAARHNFANYTIVIGAQTLHAVGYAMGVVRDQARGVDGSDIAVFVCLGDGAMSQGDVNEAFVWASTQCLPVVFFCQNNQWAISAPIELQSRVPLARRAVGFGFEGVRVDGNDVLATYSVVQAALAKARAGEGPTLVEAYTYRMNPHTTSDDANRYRSADEVESWARRDPIARVRTYLSEAGAVDDAFFAAVEHEADEVALKLRDGGRALAEPTVRDAFDHVYADPPAAMLRQRRELQEFLDLT
jgi:pyruvate dehydrogenase E1 component alpha subunit